MNIYHEINNISTSFLFKNKNKSLFDPSVIVEKKTFVGAVSHCCRIHINLRCVASSYFQPIISQSP